MTTPPLDAAAVAAGIASQWHETNPAALAQIERLVSQIGADVARALLQETQQVEAQGGLLVSSPSCLRDARPAGSSSTWRNNAWPAVTGAPSSGPVPRRRKRSGRRGLRPPRHALAICRTLGCG
jgi:hypothetical protein